MPPGVDRLSLSCRACGGAEALDVPQGVMTPARLSNMWPHCSGCRSADMEIVLRCSNLAPAGCAPSLQT
jgi:hypothetical protein